MTNETIEGRQLTAIITGPRKARIGDIVTFNARVVEGTSPYTFKWSAHPAECNGIDTDQLQCKISSSGSYVIRVDIVDSSGMTGSDMFLFGIE